MKRMMFFVGTALLIAGLALTGCTKKESTETAAPAPAPEVKMTAVNFYSQIPYVTLSIYKEPGKQWEDMLNPGQVVDLEMVDTDNDGVKDSPMTGTANGKDYYKITTDLGTEGWTQANLLAVDAVPGMITKEKAFIYTAKDETRISKLSLEMGQLIAVFPNADDDKRKSFTRIAVANGTTYTTKWFVKTKDISTAERDIIAAQTILLAESTRLKPDPEKSLEDQQGAAERLLNLIDSRMDDAVGSAIFGKLQEKKFELQELISGEASAEVEEVAPVAFASGSVIVATDDNINVRSSSDLSGAVTGQLNEGDFVEIIEVKEPAERVNGDLNYWYKVIVSDGPIEGDYQEGWVFGEFFEADGK